MFRCTIRDLLWLTVVAALTVTWWVEHRSLLQLQSQHERLERQRAAAAKESAECKESLETLALENARLEEFVRRRKLLNEAQTGTYFLGPATRGTNLGGRGSSGTQGARLGGN
jgi:hypothetical protein